MSTKQPEIVDTVAHYLALEPVILVARAACPFHEDRGRSLRVDYGLQRFACRVCGASGDAVDFVARQERVGRAEAARLLHDW